MQIWQHFLLLPIYLILSAFGLGIISISLVMIKVCFEIVKEIFDK
jgi:hypothetical protein